MRMRVLLLLRGLRELGGSQLRTAGRGRREDERQAFDALLGQRRHGVGDGRTGGAYPGQLALMALDPRHFGSRMIASTGSANSRAMLSISCWEAWRRFASTWLRWVSETPTRLANSTSLIFLALRIARMAAPFCSFTPLD